MDIKIMPEKYKRRREVTEEEKLPLVDLLGGLVSRTNLWLVLAIIILVFGAIKKV